MIDYKRLVEKTSIIYDRRRSRPAPHNSFISGGYDIGSIGKVRM